MPSKSPKPWDRVLVRHVVASRRDDLTLVQGMIKASFDESDCFSVTGKGDAEFYSRPGKRWMVAGLFKGQDWLSLFDSDASSEEVFRLNAPHRRLEVAWVGYLEEQGGWFFRLYRGR